MGSTKLEVLAPGHRRQTRRPFKGFLGLRIVSGENDDSLSSNSVRTHSDSDQPSSRQLSEYEPNTTGQSLAASRGVHVAMTLPRTHETGRAIGSPSPEGGAFFRGQLPSPVHLVDLEDEALAGGLR